MKKLKSILLVSLFVLAFSTNAKAGCSYQTVWNHESGQFITVWVCTPDPAEPSTPGSGTKCGYQTVWDPQTGTFVTVWVCP